MLELMEKHDLSTGPLWLAGQPSDAHYVPETKTSIWVKGWHKWQRSDMAGVGALADVIVVNYALHYAGNVSEYEEHMPQMFQQLSDWVAAKPGRQALFRETGADHTNMDPNLPGAKFQDEELGHPNEAVVKNCKCMQFEEAAEKAQVAYTLNAYIRGLLPSCVPLRRGGATRSGRADAPPRSLSYPKVGFIPFYDLTLPRHDMHEAGYCAFDVLHDQKRNPAQDQNPPYCWCALWYPVLLRCGALTRTLAHAATAHTSATRRNCGRRSSRAWRRRWRLRRDEVPARRMYSRCWPARLAGPRQLRGGHKAISAVRAESRAPGASITQLLCYTTNIFGDNAPAARAAVTPLPLLRHAPAVA